MQLPREIESDPRFEAIRARLTAGDRRVPAGAQTMVPVLSLDPPLAAALGTAFRIDRLVLGLEPAAEALASEERGLAHLARRAGTERATRVSRLLLLSQDGAARLNQEAERLAAMHAPRVLLVLLACDATALGLATTGRPAGVKVVLARHKETVAALLRALAPPE